MSFTVGSKLLKTEAGPMPTVKIGNSTYTIDAVNPHRRDANQLVVFTPDYGRTNKQNKWGCDVAVVDGVVTEVIDLRPDVQIPEDGYLLSGHREARSWLLENATVDSYVFVTGVDVPQPPEEEEEHENEELKQMLVELRALVGEILGRL